MALIKVGNDRVNKCRIGFVEKVDEFDNDQDEDDSCDGKITESCQSKSFEARGLYHKLYEGVAAPL